MATRSVKLKANMSKFVEEITNLLFISVYQSIKEIDLMICPMMLADEHYYLVCFNLRDPQIHILDNMNVKDSIKNRYGKKFTHVAHGTYSGKKDFDARFLPEGKEQKKQIEDLRKKYITKILLSEFNENVPVVESEIEYYHRLTLKEKKMLQDKSAKNIADRASEYFENQASALLKEKKKE
ncbi:hypothetical protein CTI12_AA260620 [Artemisia annua]|uniref:Ulp1 protease family, C-terminal catalytic domain-containing protein n=1 Tax=Artemisia annua TaxID=35608 RepID=A0A2U1NJ90_ARTAN|nr:hypothetical protein CTI12_AA260620 [Artemisia annua]